MFSIPLESSPLLLSANTLFLPASPDTVSRAAMPVFPACFVDLAPPANFWRLLPLGRGLGRGR